MKRVLALTKYGPMAASTRQRFVQFEPALRDAGFEVEYSALLGDDHMHRLVQGRHTSAVGAVSAYARRVAMLRKVRRFDLLWLQYEFFPFAPALVERLAARLTKVPIVVDYDDALFHRYDGNAPWWVRRVAKGKLEPLLRRAAACTCGNDYVRDYAARFCERSIVVPTVVDTSIYRPAGRSKDRPPVIGWIGSPSTWANVRPLLPLLEKLSGDKGVRVRAVGAGVAATADRFPGLELVDWSEATEVAEVQAMDIGIMPLADRPFERGKSGFKLIQYMACGLPVVASPVGVNRDIVRDGENGFLAGDDAQWAEALGTLIGDPGLRRRLGQSGRERAERDYSLASQAPKLVDLFGSILRD